MPCNAVATARARVSSEAIARLLTPEVVTPVVKVFLAQYLKANVPEPSQWTNTWTKQQTLTVVVGGYTINITGGEVQVTHPNNYSGARALADKLQELLTATGGMLLQNKVKATLQQVGTITEQVKAPNGALVLRMRI